MNALTIWVTIPLITALLLYSFRRWESAVQVAGIFVSCILAWIAWRLPIGELVQLRLGAGFPPLRVAEGVTFLGQRLILVNSARPVIALVYLALAFWLGGAHTAGVNRWFVPSSMTISALVIAALAVEASWYTPLVVELMALATVPLLSPPGKQTSRGTLRFMIFQTIGVCLVLLSERWWLAVSTTQGNTQALPFLILVIGVGYASILAVIPFHTWIPMIAEEINPYTAAFIFYTLPVGISFLLLKNLDRYVFLGASDVILAGLRYMGILMIVAGGIWASFERHLGRILGFTSLAQIGVLLLAVSFSHESSPDPSLTGILFALLIPMMVGMAVFAQALCAIQRRSPDLQPGSTQGLAHSMPAAAICLIAAQFSLSGLPLFASFPIYSILWSALGRDSVLSVLFFIGGIACLLAASWRTLSLLVIGKDGAVRRESESRLQSILMILGSAILLIEGLAPQWLGSVLIEAGRIFIGSGP